MSTGEVVNEHDQKQRVMTYILEKFEHYANRSHLWQLVYSSRIRHRLLRKCRHISMAHSISEELVHQYIRQVFNDVDQCTAEFNQIFSSKIFDDLILAFKHNNKIDNVWHSMQLERARQLFVINSSNQQQNDNELLENYYTYIQNNLTPKKDLSSGNGIEKPCENSFDLDVAYQEAGSKAKNYIANTLKRFQKQKVPNLKLIDEMIKLGMNDMKKIPSKEDFRETNSFFERLLMLHKTKEAYKCILHNTGDDFMLLRFGRVFGRHELANTAQYNKQFTYLLHLFIKSIIILLISLTVKVPEKLISSIQKISPLFMIDDDPSIIKLHFDLLSPESNIDQWTWLLEQWRDVLRTMPLLLTKAGAFSRLVRTTIGIGLIHLGKCAEIMVTTGYQTITAETMNAQLFCALQKGFYFGIAYAVVDCLQDEFHNLDEMPLHHWLALDNDEGNRMTATETIDKWLLIMEKLLSGQDFDRALLPKTPFTKMLIESFDSLLILTQSTDTTRECCNELALLLRSQRADKKVMGEHYDDMQLYIGSVLKSHFTYTCATHLGDMSTARVGDDRLWYIPFLGQLTDDVRDYNNDIRSSSVTPFTYYAGMMEHKEPMVKHLYNPFYIFLNLCSDIYLSSNRNSKTGAFLGRRIARALRTIEITSDETALEKFLSVFCSDGPKLHDYFWNKLRTQFPNITDPEKAFFRKIDSISVQFSRTNRRLETYIFENSSKVEDALRISLLNSQQSNIREEEILISAMNYSVTAGGKRLRVFLLLIVADLYGIEFTRSSPLACGIEYLHTSSLIFDDLPAQDNSDLRRGRPTLHKTTINDDVPDNLCEGRAQLAAVGLIATSMSLINNSLLKVGFSSERVNHVIREISSLMHSLCVGQLMDLRAARVDMKQNNLQIDELDQIAWLKTGKTIEAVLISPAILSAHLSEDLTVELSHLRNLSRLMGILFQMRDDLLDLEASDTIGKPTALDIKNNTITYISLLGIEGTRARIQQYQTETLKLIDHCWPAGAETLKDVIRYIVSRKS